eukprot:287243_1
MSHLLHRVLILWEVTVLLTTLLHVRADGVNSVYVEQILDEALDAWGLIQVPTLANGLESVPHPGLVNRPTSSEQQFEPKFLHPHDLPVGGFNDPLILSCIPGHNHQSLNVSRDDCAQACVRDHKCMSFEYQRDGVDLSADDVPCHIQRTVSGVLEHRCPQFDYYRRFVPVCEVSPPLHGYIKGQQQESHMVLPGDISFVCDDGYHFPGDSNFKKLEKIISCDPMDNGLEAEMAEELPKKCVQFCAISAPVNGKVDARPSLAVTVNRSFTMKCDAGYRLRNITTLS